MNFYLKAIIALMLILTPQIVRADMDFISRMLFSDRSYAKNIEIKAYIITQEQACVILNDLSQELYQLDNKELYDKKTYLFLKIRRNSGKKHAWGTLSCRVPRYHFPIKIPILDIEGPQNYNTYLIHLGKIVNAPNKPGTPKISTFWDELYTK